MGRTILLRLMFFLILKFQFTYTVFYIHQLKSIYIYQKIIFAIVPRSRSLKIEGLYPSKFIFLDIRLSILIDIRYSMLQNTPSGLSIYNLYSNENAHADRG